MGSGNLTFKWVSRAILIIPRHRFNAGRHVDTWLNVAAHLDVGMSLMLAGLRHVTHLLSHQKVRLTGINAKFSNLLYKTITTKGTYKYHGG